MSGKALCLLGGLFLCVHVSAQENDQRFAETLNARQRLATRIIRLPADAEPIRNLVDDVRCARGRYSFDCSVPPPVMKRPVDLVIIERAPCLPRSFLSPGWRCDEP